jgi:hypothetical protein
MLRGHLSTALTSRYRLISIAAHFEENKASISLLRL